MCRSKIQPKSGKSDQQNKFCEEEGNLCGQTSSEMEMGMYYTRENVFNMSVTWEYITVKDHKIKVQIDTGAYRTVISSLIWTELVKPHLNKKIRHLEAYDGHQLTLLGSLTFDVEWNGSKYRQQQLAVVQSHKKIGLLGREIRRRQCSERRKNTCSQRIQSACETHIGITTNVLQSQTDTSTSQREGQREA